MKYQSTRNHALTASPAAAVLQGIAPDGGLYMPEAIPVLDWQSLMKEDTLTMSARILSALLPDYEDMPALVRRGYAGKFETEDLTPLVSVGDRYVLENMRENGYAIGGEQSGHVILLHHATTGDGELTAGKLLKLLAESGKKMSELNGIYAQYPQVLVNVAANAAQKAAYKEDKVLADFIGNEQQKLMDMGRVLVRVSGTEPKIRVMVEGQDLEAIDLCAKRIVDKINERIIEG